MPMWRWCNRRTAVSGGNPLNEKELADLLEGILNHGRSGCTALSLAATSEIAALLESQDKTMLEQNNQIIRLTLAQLVVR